MERCALPAVRVRDSDAALAYPPTAIPVHRADPSFTSGGVEWANSVPSRGAARHNDLRAGECPSRRVSSQTLQSDARRSELGTSLQPAREVDPEPEERRDHSVAGLRASDVGEEPGREQER